jgi:Capsule assembly protein Wzi/PAP2 superfamily
MTNVRFVLSYCVLCLSLLAFTGSTSGAPRLQESQDPASGVDDSTSDTKPNEKTKLKREKLDATRPDPAGADRSIGTLTRDFVYDQKEIWTSPKHLRFADADWLVPASGFAAALFVTDSDVSRHLSSNPQTISHYKTYSTAGLGALIGTGAGMFLLSYPTHNEHWRETGLLAGEAAIDSLIPIEVMKYSLRRQRPYQGDGTGPFFQGGTSFPSEHAAAAWAIAGVFAHEYPGLFPKLVSYGLASFVSYSRIKGKQHFPSDVFIGSLAGQLIAQNVYSRHHDPSLGGDEWRSIGQIVRGDGYLPANKQGSPYVPLDSWIYPAIERLMAMGAINTAFASLRPWTRTECARLLGEAGDGVDDSDTGEVAKIYNMLQLEFRDELENDGGILRARIESVYARVTGISGNPLGAGLHYDFGQTFTNDYGRPYEAGVNSITGISGWASSGRWVAYVRAEYQHAPSAPPLSLSARETIAQAQVVPSLPPDTPINAVNRVQLLDAYAGLNLDNWQITFGQQSLWWGPTSGGPMLFSDNAEPIPMFRISRVSPLQLPWIFGFLGPMRLEVFFGQLSGQQFIQGPNGTTGTFLQPYSAQPYLHGEKIAFKPTRNFEFSFSRTTIMAGLGVPLTFGTFGKSLFTVSGAVSANGSPGSANDPGDRRSAMDWEYRLPKLRNWVTFYGDAFSDDQISPIAYLDRSAISAGLYFSHLPKVPKFDFRVEGVYSDVPAGGAIGGGFFYWNTRYLSGYTNNGNLLGSWIGRDGQGAQGWANYWFTPRNRLKFYYRHEKVSQDPRFIPGGGTITDGSIGADVWTTRSLAFSGNVQYEAWTFPSIVAGQQRNLSVSLQVQFNPAGWSSRGGNP